MDTSDSLRLIKQVNQVSCIMTQCSMADPVRGAAVPERIPRPFTTAADVTSLHAFRTDLSKNGA